MRRLILAFAVLTLAGLVFTACGSDGNSDVATGPPGQGLAARTVTAGEIDVTIEPTQLDAQGATFEIILDTHAVELSMDLTRSRLDVGGTAWKVAGWTGDGPSGHHREGKLRFSATSPDEGTARLTLAGFPEAVEVTWDLGT